jgi:hypothetical protein
MKQLPIAQQLTVELLKETISLRTAIHTIRQELPDTYIRDGNQYHNADYSWYLSVNKDNGLCWSDKYGWWDIANHGDLQDIIELHRHNNQSNLFRPDYDQVQEEISELLEDYNILGDPIYQWSFRADERRLTWNSNWDAYGSDTYYDDDEIRIVVFREDGLTQMEVEVKNGRYRTRGTETVTSYQDIIEYIEEYESEIVKARDNYHEHCIDCLYPEDEEDEDEFIHLEAEPA